MASRLRSISKPTLSFFKFAVKKPNSRPGFPNPPSPRSSPLPRVRRELGSLQTLLPLHTAVSSARLTSRLSESSTTSISFGLRIPP